MCHRNLDNIPWVGTIFVRTPESPLRWSFLLRLPHASVDPDSKFHVAHMGPTWVLSAPGGPHISPMKLAIRGVFEPPLSSWPESSPAMGPDAYRSRRPRTSSSVVFLYWFETTLTMFLKSMHKHCIVLLLTTQLFWVPRGTKPHNYWAPWFSQTGVWVKAWVDN